MKDLNKPPVERKDIYSYDVFKEYAKIKEYIVFSSIDKSHNLNIWGVRSDNQHSGKFDDKLFIWTNDLFEEYIVTVDPSDIYLLNPINKKGTAIITPGQYRGVWRKGYHQGRSDHPALVQVKPITVYRDFNKDNILDINKPIYSHQRMRNLPDGSKVIEYINNKFEVVFIKHTGLFGINCHRASKWKIKEKIGLYSAGCVVHKDPFRYKNEFLVTIDTAILNWGNGFTFTLITEKELIEFYNNDYAKSN